MDEIAISDYTYELPHDRIALHPLDRRDKSKLLVYKHGQITHSSFDQLPNRLPSDSILFFNDTKVIPARILFQKETGAAIEIFLLTPIAPSELLQLAMEASASTTWKCIIGNIKRWPDGQILTRTLDGIRLHAILENREQGIVKFSWQPSSSAFAKVLSLAGSTPLPPYIKRAVQADDEHRYQTVYSQTQGAVAAPTAGLHFTEDILKALSASGVIKDFLTLHVGAGTFQPVKVRLANDHSMHAEQLVVTLDNIDNLLIPGKKHVAVGTTSMRALESLYWFGVKLLLNNSKPAPFVVNQFDPYQLDGSISVIAALEAVKNLMKNKAVDSITGTTSVMIVPGYQFRICDALITNFHQPGSTLMLLVAAFAGEGWRTIYQEALANNYRFLSFGDSSLIIRAPAQ